jgi:vacuolar iron transporter family protein
MSSLMVSEKHVIEEKVRIGKLSQIREIIFGMQDGLLVPLGVISTVAAAFNNNHIVIVAGISEALAGAFSMATGAYLASHAEDQVHKSEIKKEKLEISKKPDVEKQEMVLLFKKEGVSPKDSKTITNIMWKYPSSFATTMVQKELGLEPEPEGGAVKDAVYVGISYLFSAFIPLFPYFFLEGESAIIVSILATFVALFFAGALKGKFSSTSMVKGGLQILIVGAGSGIGGYFLGRVLPQLLGL